MTYAPYERCYACAGKAQPGAVNLLKYLMNRYSYTKSLGIYNCRYIGGTTTLSNHSCGIAIDLYIPHNGWGNARPELGNPVVQFLSSISSTIGLTEQIYNRVRYSRSYPSGKYYGGQHPHHDHIHMSITKAKGQSLTYAQIVSAGGSPTTGEGEDVLYGLDIGKTGDASLSDAPAHRVLQAFLASQGQDIGEWGPNGDGVDGQPGDDTRAGLHNWKVSAGITAATSAGEGKIGDYEMAAIYAAGGAASAPDVDLSDYYTKSQADSRYPRKGEKRSITL